MKKKWKDPEFRAKQKAARDARSPAEWEEIKHKISESNMGQSRPHTTATKKKMSKTRIGKKKSPEWRTKIAEAIRKKHLEEGYTERIAASNTGKQRTEETKKKLSASLLGRKLTKEHKKNIGVGAKKNFQDPKYCRKLAKSCALKPNGAEWKLGLMLEELFPNEYKFVGDSQFWLGGKNPDFMNVNGQKKLIELYGDYWHAGDDPQDRVDFFKQYGFDTLVVWENELQSKRKLMQILLKFHKEKENGIN
jgi:hypothetical protein